MSSANNSINPGISTSPEVNKLALVVGVNNSSIAPPYRPTLKYAEKDAQDMASLLNQPECSFTLLMPALTGEKATSGNIKQRVIELVRKREKEDFLLFYYAGHAIPIENDIYFITHDFQEEHVEFDPDLYLSMRWLWKVLYQSAGAGRVLLILDCCYAGNMVEAKEDPLKIDLRKLLDEWNTGSNGKDQKNCLRLILTATGYNNPAQEQDGHGLMTGFLLKALRGEVHEVLDKDGHVDVSYIYKYLRINMQEGQCPDLSGKWGGYDCILVSYPEKAAQLRSQHKGRRGAERPHSYIPFPRNPLFQPRPSEFERLEMLLSGENAEQPTRIGLVGVTGMGGIGKTQLAVELAYRLQKQHRFAGGIFWTPATGMNVFEWQHSMAELAFNADYLPIDDDPSSPENEARRARYFCRYLANHADALLILDNVEDPELVTSALPILAGGSLACSILYTSRITQTPHGVAAHSVEQLPEDAALHLLLETTRPALLSETLSGTHSPEANAAHSVCSMVGYVPLALVHLRSFLTQDRQVSLCCLIEVLNNRGISGVAATVIQTFRLSWEKVRTEEAQCMFLLASYFPEAAPIPLWLLGLASGLGENGNIFEPLGQARFHLLELSLLEELSNEQVRLHPLVREFGRQLVTEDKGKGKVLQEKATKRLITEFEDLCKLDQCARSTTYWECLDKIKTAREYAVLLKNNHAEHLVQLERWLDCESRLLSVGNLWPDVIPGLFYQQLYNRAIEEGCHFTAEAMPEQWLRQLEPVGAEDQALLRVFAGHSQGIRSVTFSPDGTKVLTGSLDGTGRLWDVASGKPLITFDGHQDMVMGVAFSSDGAKVLTGSLDDTARTWDAMSGKLLVTFTGHKYSVNSVAFSPDGTKVLTGSYDKTARLWDAASGKPLITFDGHLSGVDSVAFSPDGTKVLTGSGDKTARLWNITSGKVLVTFKPHWGRIESVAFSPDGTKVLTGSGDKIVRLWETTSGKILKRFKGHQRWIHTVAFSSDGTKILTCSGDGTLKLWETISGKQLPFEIQQNSVKSGAFSPDGTKILTGSLDGVARLWKIERGEQIAFESHTAEIASMIFSPDGTMLLTCSNDETVKLWDVTSRRVLVTFKGHHSFVRSGAFSPDGMKVMTVSFDGTAQLWEAANGKPLMTFEGRGGESVTFSPDGRKILTGFTGISESDRGALLWNVASGKPLAKFEGSKKSVESVAFSPDGRKVLTGSYDKIARLWDTKGGKLLVRFKDHDGSVESVTFSPDGMRVLTGSLDGKGRLWDVATGKLLVTFEGHHGGLKYVTFSPDGRLVITCDEYGQVRLWRAATPEIGLLVGVYVATYEIGAIYWQNATHVVLADKGGPRFRPHFYRLKLEGIG